MEKNARMLRSFEKNGCPTLGKWLLVKGYKVEMAIGFFSSSRERVRKEIAIDAIDLREYENTNGKKLS